MASYYYERHMHILVFERCADISVHVCVVRRRECIYVCRVVAAHHAHIYVCTYMYCVVAAVGATKGVCGCVVHIFIFSLRYYALSHTHTLVTTTTTSSKHLRRIYNTTRHTHWLLLRPTTHTHTLVTTTTTYY
eukprot:GHVS01038180.1.p1 GENE.GHVS01038180.1~~GHVS01038180.1.p1  ORF type:complete len:133 (-),score=20.92 GHVS01038180.1:390-788(-)